MNNLQCVPYVDIDFCINNLIFSSSSAVSGHKCKWSHNVITTKNLTRKSRRQKHDWVRTKWSEAPQSTASSRGVTVERSPFISSCLSAQKEISWEEKTHLLQKPERRTMWHVWSWLRALQRSTTRSRNLSHSIRSDRSQRGSSSRVSSPPEERRHVVHHRSLSALYLQII